MASSEFARPLYEQRLERALKLGPFLDYVETVINEPLSDSDDDTDTEIYEEYLKNGLPGNPEDGEDKDRDCSMYNLSSIKKKRQWLKEALLSSSDEEDNDTALSEEDLQDMLREHKFRKKYQLQFRQKEESMGYMYYSAGLLSRVDKYPEHQKYLSGSKRKKNKHKKEKDKKIKIKEEPESEESKEPLPPLKIKEEPLMSDYVEDTSDEMNIKNSRTKSSKKDKKPKKLDAQALAIRRHKLWVLMAKKEVSRCQKSKQSCRREVLQNCKKMATGCMRYCRQKALQSQKTVKEKVWFLKRLTRTMQNEWKKYDRIMKEQNKRAEKEAEEQRKIDKEILEAKRQQRKMNFLITLPELYAHFMKNKLNSTSHDDGETNNILKQLEDDQPLPSSVADDYDCEAMKSQALQTAQDAYSNQISRVNVTEANYMPRTSLSTPKEHPQPSVFVGQLKSYQLKGMNWLANLYYFGINGILADEMGLGKTVQSVAFLGHICEEYDTWGPFLIVTPASTLHNWTCELSRFVPSFKVVPYWGNPEERKNLRKFFDGKSLGMKEASFHIVVTSYQIVIQDFKFLNRLKWNYMVLDEAQAIKSINSQRWKQLLGFSCRNRLLLSGTPIQNSMAELWALLHFIMPTLFDSHNWFNEWFSKDIEGHVENKTAVDEKHLNRLHLILKPFMLRRVKTEVENELSDKIEIMMYCPLTLRQKYLYNGLKNKISIEELLRSSMNNLSFQSVTNSLMNLVMQFRKVCNHPELLERREVRSPFTLIPDPYLLPKLMFRESLFNEFLPSRSHLLDNHLSIFHPAYVHNSLKACFQRESRGCCFSFLRFIDMSVMEFSKFIFGGMFARWISLLIFLENSQMRHQRQLWWDRISSKKDFLIFENPLSASIIKESLLGNLVFTSYKSAFYTFQDHLIHYVPETHPHRLMRCQKLKNKFKVQDLNLDTDIKIEDSFPFTNGSPSSEYTFDDYPDVKPFGSDITNYLASPTRCSTMTPTKSASRNIATISPTSGCAILTPMKSTSRSNAAISPTRGSSVSPTKSITRSNAGISPTRGGMEGSPISPTRRHSPIKSSPTSYLRLSKKSSKHSHKTKNNIKKEPESFNDPFRLPEFPHLERDPITRTCQPTTVPTFLLHTCPKSRSTYQECYSFDRSAAYRNLVLSGSCPSPELSTLLFGSAQRQLDWRVRNTRIRPPDVEGLWGLSSKLGWNHILIPDKHTLIMDAGKLYVLDSLLSRLKAGNHRVLIYSQMTKMIDLLEEYMWHRKHKYMRLDGSSKISDRRDMVEDFQNKSDIFVFLLSTRAGGVGINLTAADTVIFYDSDWNPTVDQQAMDRAHRLGQTKQVTVFRLICKDTIEERILQRAREKSEIQRMVISGGNFKPDTLKPKEVVSLLLDADIEKEYRAKQAERRAVEDQKMEMNREKMRERMRKRYLEKKFEKEQVKRRKIEDDMCDIDICGDQSISSNPPSPSLSEGSQFGVSVCGTDEGSSDALQIIDVETPPAPTSISATFSTISGSNSGGLSPTTAPLRRHRKRGRPRGSGVRGRASRAVADSGSQLPNGAISPPDSSSQVLNGDHGVSTPVTSNSSPSAGSGGAPREPKRGRGRPRLIPLGPGHQGTRPPPALPVALGSTLGSNLGTVQVPEMKNSYHFTS